MAIIPEFKRKVSDDILQKNLILFRYGLINYANVKLPKCSKKTNIDPHISTKIHAIEFCFFLKKGIVLSYLYAKNYKLTPETSCGKPAQSAEK